MQFVCLFCICFNKMIIFLFAFDFAMFQKLIFLIILSVPSLLSWGRLGHQLVGSIAQHYLTDTTMQAIMHILNLEEKGAFMLARIATWADEVKKSRQYHYSASYHYVDTHDHAPEHCNFDLKHDCNNNKCVIGAIYNYTSQLVDINAEMETKNVALKFVVHLIGDIFQPLHCLGQERGGNQDHVHFEHHKTNMHSVWDSAILTKAYKENHQFLYSQYLQYFLKNIQNGLWPIDRCPLSYDDNFVTAANYSMDLIQRPKNHHQMVLVENNDFVKPNTSIAICPTQWATKSNKLNCEYAYRNFRSGQQCSGQYYEENLPVVEQQIAKSGRTLADVLNTLFDQNYKQ